MPASSSPLDGAILILGCGVNGACVARELAINGVPVVIVDEADVACGASSKSSRLIHGGLRYLEYGDFGLVKESLDERRRLLQLAPQFVHPLKLHIPIRRRLGGLLAGGVKFLKLTRLPVAGGLASKLASSRDRGLWAVRTGLAMYDRLAGRDNLPKSEVHQVGEPGIPLVDPTQYQWVCSYWDAQILETERFVLALLKDAQRAAAERGSLFDLRTYTRAKLDGDGIVLHAIDPAADAWSANSSPEKFRPALIINATGAWGDWTLRELPVSAPKLFGGTRGSHIITRHAGLRDAIAGEAIYAEASDGRLVFILPWGNAVMVGTTDERFDERPDQAVAMPEEIAYLVRMANEVFPLVGLAEADVAVHYSGIRPLPNAEAGRTAAISRDHDIDSRTTSNDIPIDTLVGGKLTTCRAFGEIVADRVLVRLGRERTAHSADRVIPGGDGYPASEAILQTHLARLADESNLPVESVEAVWSLFGSETDTLLAALFGSSATPPVDRTPLPGTPFPVAIIDWIIRNEWVNGVPDVVERRLTLPFRGPVRDETLTAIEDRMVALRGSCSAGAVQSRQRLKNCYGVNVAP